MPMTLNCPQCNSSFRVPETLAGKDGKCRQCGAVVRVPQSDAGIRVCTGCGADISHARRVKDKVGNYFCEPCWATHVSSHAKDVAQSKKDQVAIMDGSVQPAALDKSVPLFCEQCDGQFAVEELQNIGGRILCNKCSLSPSPRQRPILYQGNGDPLDRNEKDIYRQLLKINRFGYFLLILNLVILFVLTGVWGKDIGLLGLIGFVIQGISWLKLQKFRRRIRTYYQDMGGNPLSDREHTRFKVLRWLLWGSWASVAIGLVVGATAADSEDDFWKWFGVSLLVIGLIAVAVIAVLLHPLQRRLAEARGDKWSFFHRESKVKQYEDQLR
jgi:hypothetical protein